MLSKVTPCAFAGKVQTKPSDKSAREQSRRAFAIEGLVWPESFQSRLTGWLAVVILQDPMCLILPRPGRLHADATSPDHLWRSR